MKWTRSHLSFANVISLIALFVALGGTGYAATQLAKNSVGGKQIKRNAVGASEIRANAVRASEIRSNAVGGADILDNGISAADLANDSVGSAELTPGSVGTSEVTDDSLTAADISGATLDIEVGPDAFARVGANGTLDAGTPSQNKVVVQANVQHDAVASATTTGPGVYCFGGLPFEPRSAIVTADAAMAINTTNFIASVAVQRGNNLGNCDAAHQQARVSMLQVSDAVAPALVDHGFYIWFEG